MVDKGHDTESGIATTLEPDGSGIETLDHDVPSQRSASGAALSAGAPEVPVVPTAMQDVIDEHETPLRKVNGAPVGGVACTVQSLPSHRSASALVFVCP
jgi:hypothetical protein